MLGEEYTEEIAIVRAVPSQWIQEALEVDEFRLTSVYSGLDVSAFVPTVVDGGHHFDPAASQEEVGQHVRHRSAG